MKRSMGTKWGCAVLAALALVLGWAAEGNAEERDPPKAAYTPRLEYHVYSSLGCSRSWQRQSSHASASEALYAARELRRSLQVERVRSCRVEVWTGEGSEAVCPFTAPLCCEVQGISCKAWRWEGLYETRLEALARACQVVATGDVVEMLYYSRGK